MHFRDYTKNLRHPQFNRSHESSSVSLKKGVDVKEAEISYSHVKETNKRHFKKSQVYSVNREGINSFDDKFLTLQSQRVTIQFTIDSFTQYCTKKNEIMLTRN